MVNIKTLKSIVRNDREEAGERAVDLAVLASKDFRVPPSFVVTNSAFESFIQHNTLQEEMAESLALPNKMRSYEKIREAVLRGHFSKEMVAEIVDHYESVSVDEKAALGAIVDEEGAPNVTLILSPNHTVPSESNEGVILNVQGLEELLLALKECWACLFTPGMQVHRERGGITNRNLNTGVIVQQTASGETTAEGWSAHGSDAGEIVVRSYFGSLDLGHGVEKDEMRLSKEYLKPVYQSVAIQTAILGKDEEGRLSRMPIGNRGEEQKLNDRMMIELGRLTKKAQATLGCHVKLAFDVQGEEPRPLLCTRLLLTAGSIKLQGFKQEEHIEENPEQTESTAAVEAASEGHVMPTTRAEEVVPPSTASPSEHPRVDVGMETAQDASTVTPVDDAEVEIVEAPAQESAEAKEVQEAPSEESTDLLTKAVADESDDETIFTNLAPDEEDRTLVQAYAEVLDALNARYEARFRNQAPDSATKLFAELSEEVIIPHEEEIRDLIHIVEQEEKCEPESERRILEVIDDFLEKIR